MKKDKAKKNDPNSERGSGERLSFTTFLAIIIHAGIIFGIGFQSSYAPSRPEINVTLATQPSANSPEVADFLAQFNQEGSGSENEAKKVRFECSRGYHIIVACQSAYFYTDTHA